ncbi:uncharacterized protein KY384_007141 [Bacidia gigantensis]|uniref:uncharacterized protein n=1 Tax=Bacidia gigantensis TaxID=2732470 RepID=UPI001D051D53|nr:uncharacterized protein KY384_007141 [Bacidia gigantensis]KAG8528224.1 hypothetical protein KY384_007141 [Bacidia gigantensis]
MPSEDRNLQSLPKEIRLIIYDYLFTPQYFRQWPSSRAIDTIPNSLSILRTCTAIKNEASYFLYSSRTFQFHLPNSLDNTRTILPDSAFKNLMNIYIATWEMGSLRGRVPDQMSENLATLLSRFSGSSILRSRLTIVLDPSKQALCKPESEVVDSLGKLNGFQKVLVEFKADLWRSRHLLDRARRAGRLWDPTRQTECEFYDEIVGKIMHRVELGLGEGKVCSDIPSAQGPQYVRWVEFKPRG